MNRVHLLALLLLGTCAATTPPYTLYPNTSNVFGRGQVNRSAGVVRYVGRLPTEADCLNACLSFTDPSDGAICNSFTYHHMDYPSADFAGTALLRLWHHCPATDE